MSRICSGFRAVDGRVKGGVVVHLELAVDFEAALAGEDLLPEVVEAEDEVFALFGEEGQAFAIAFAMAGGRFRAVDLLLGVVDLQRQDGKAVDHESGALGIQRSRGSGTALRAEGLGGPLEENCVALFGEVVAALVEVVDGALNLDDLFGRGAGGAGAVLGVPQVEVGAMLGADGLQKILFGRAGVPGFGWLRTLVPLRGRAVVQSSDGARGKWKSGGHV